jgi:hypothetical protein
VFHWIHLLAVLQDLQEAEPESGGALSWLAQLYWYPGWWLVALQLLAIVHLIRRGGSFYWIWLIFAAGSLGVLIYFFVEVVPDVSLLRDAFGRYGRRKLIDRVENAILDNPSAGNYEELAELYADQRNFKKAREAYDNAIARRNDSLHSFYGRALCALELGDADTAVSDLYRVVVADGKFANYRAASLLAHAYALAGRAEDATTMYDQIMPYSPTIETMYNYAFFLRSRGNVAQAREWIEKMMQAKRSMPRFFQRRERPLFRKASALLKDLKRQAQRTA